MKRLIVAAFVLVSVVSLNSGAEPMRPLFTRENRFPEPLQAEAGAYYTYVEYGDQEEAARLGDANQQEIRPYARVGLADGLAAWVELPYRWVDWDYRDDAEGISDVVLGFDFRAFQDVFGYPYIIPHASLQLDTGDEKKGLGEGDTVPEFGISAGTVVQDRFHFIVDAAYRIYEHKENIGVFSGTLIWDVDRRLSLLAEARGTTEDIGPNENHPGLFLGGICYRVSDMVEVTFYGGGGKHSPEDVIAGVRLSCSF